MKLLTFAFVIQFIIACWPKIDIIDPYDSLWCKRNPLLSILTSPVFPSPVEAATIMVKGCHSVRPFSVN